MNPGSSAFLVVIRESTPERYRSMSAEERREALLQWNAWCDSLAAQGRLQAGAPLEPEGVVVSAGRGQRVVDGPFAEAKEMIGGYLLLTADSLDEAEAIVRESPSLRFGMTIEIRPLARRCHLARSLGWETMREPEAAAR